MARARWSGPNTFQIRAIELGWVAAPSMPASVRSTMSDGAFQANTVTKAITAEAIEPARKTRR